MVPVKSLYLDYNATSPLSPSVLDWLKSGDFVFANPSSQHSAGKASRKIINESRAQLFSVFSKNEKDNSLFFHSGATEAMITLAYSFSEWARLTGKDLLICYSKLDHPAVTALSERYFGNHVKFLELKINHQLDYVHSANLQMIQDKKDNNPDLIILYHHLWVHNETGSVSPLQPLKLLKAIPDLFIHVDAVQAPGKIPDWNVLDVGDVFTFSGHKFGALKGIGFSFIDKKISFSALISGGGQQSGLRSGTENPQAVKSLSLALNDLLKVDVKKNMLQREKLETFIKAELNGIGGVIEPQMKNSNTIYFYLQNLSSDIALALFDQGGMEISAGSACSSGTAKPSAVMTHLGYKDEVKNGLRLSFGPQVSDSELQLIQDKFQIIVNRIKKN
ncbi:MAG: aminotransferase class V-fold PLP-dependent enzyme [Bdellovibrionales bacterium]|nr:aminotransferase class V-fold PLP-dependent enzyme [Bdellovibrionales bacterium]